jgi:hypothetical protein
MYDNGTNIGIGTNNPTRKLHIDGGTNTTVGIYLDANTISGTELEQSSDAFRLQVRDNIPLLLYTNNTERVRIAADGNVGIGISSPTQKLEVQGNIQAGNDSTTTVGFKLTRLLGGVRTSEHTFHSANNSPWYTYGQNLNWTGELAGTVESTQAYRPYIEGFAPAAGYKIFGFMDVSSGAFTSANIVNSLILKNDGNVGIGTTSPSSKLHLSGTGTTELRLVSTTSNTNSLISFYELSLASWGIDAGQANGSFFIKDLYNTRTVLTLNSSGNVGIGTTGPSSKLHISNTAAATRITITDDVSNGRSGYIESNYSDALVIGTTSGVRSIRFAPDNSTAMTIAVGTNNVGIGTTNPATKLEVYGVVRVTESASGGILQMQAGSTLDFASTFYGGTYRPFTFTNGGSERMRIQSDGNVGIGTSTPYNLLDVAGGIHTQGNLRNSWNDWVWNVAQYPYNYSTSPSYFMGFSLNTANRIFYISNKNNDGSASEPNGSIIFRTGATPDDRMIITYAGNVGIGRNSTSYKLDVAGPTRLGSSISNAHVITGSLNVGGGTFNNAISIDRMDYYQLQPYIEGGSLPENVLQRGGGTTPTFTTLTGSLCPFGKVAYNTSYYEAIGDFIPVNPGETLYGEIWGYRSTGATGTGGGLYVGIARYDKDKNPIATNLALTYFIASAVNVPLNSTWTKYSGTTTLPLTHTPFGGSDGGPVRYVRPYIIVNYPSGTIPTYWGAFKIRKQQLTRDNGALTISGSLGIGTSSPATKLHVYDSTAGYRAIRVQSAVGDAGIELMGSGGNMFNIQQPNATTGLFFYDRTNLAERMRIDSNGNIGIGTSSPAYKLDVVGSINTSTFMYVSYQYGDAYPLQLVGSNFLKANNNYYGLLIRSGDTNFISGRLSLIGGSSKRLEVYGYEETIGYIPTVIPGGNVGIGTTSPNARLHIRGGTELLNTSGSTSGATSGSLMIVGQNTKGGANYHDFLYTKNSKTTLNPNKHFRLDNIGNFEIINSAYTSAIFTLTDSGSLVLPTAQARNVTQLRNTGAGLKVGNYGLLFDDGNVHFHSTSPGTNIWLNCSGSGNFIINGQSGATGGVGIGTSTMSGYVTINGGSTVTIGAYGYLINTGSPPTGTGAGTTANYSITCTQRVQATEFDATSDERLKNIEGEIPLNQAVDFVNKVIPIKYKWKDGIDPASKTGYSAQQVYKAGFDHLVSVVKKEGMEEIVEPDGFISPKDAQFVMNYEQVTPYHSKLIKHLLDKVEKLEKEMELLKNRL